MDRVKITVVGGRGGDGIISFRHEKYIPFGGPDGGDGGHGGDVYVIADRSVASLDCFRYKRRFKAEAGKHGGKQKKHGAKGDDLSIGVPLGTMVFSKQDSQEVLLADISQQDQEVLVAKGGKGGLGNARFATARNRAPRMATSGGHGEECRLIFEFKIIADVAIIGYPNVGKSTLLVAMSKASPKIADYPFTTQEPVPGVVEVEMRVFVVVEIPAIVGGAHLGKGLGHKFLRHAERTKFLLHLLDGSSLSIFDDMQKLNAELALYNPALAEKPQVVVVNKIDLPEVQSRMSELRELFGSLGIKVFFVSAIARQGMAELISEITEMLDRAREEWAAPEMPTAVFRPKPKVKRNK